MRDAIMVALNREAADAEGKPTRKLYLIADKLVDLAASGDMQAIKEVNDRVDGKAPQTIAGDPESPLDLLGGLGAAIDSKLDRLIAARIAGPETKPE